MGAYDDYLKSPIWAAKRQEALARDGEKCRFCYSSKSLQVHHRHYPKVYGEEPLADLITLCGLCHEVFHLQREITQQSFRKESKQPKKQTVSTKKNRSEKKQIRAATNAQSWAAFKKLKEMGIIENTNQIPRLSIIAWKISECQGKVFDPLAGKRYFQRIVAEFLSLNNIDLSMKAIKN